MTKGISRNSLLVLTLLFLHIPVHGRVSIGRLAGRVTDQSGAVVGRGGRRHRERVNRSGQSGGNQKPRDSLVPVFWRRAGAAMR